MKAEMRSEWELEGEKPEAPCADIKFGVAPSSLGLVLVGRGAEGVCAVLLGDDRRALQRDLQERFRDATLLEADAELGALLEKVVQLVDAPSRSLEMPLELRGTEFQRKVWRALREIPAGSSASYAEIARRIGIPNGARAVAQACAANPLAVVIPCHRVVSSGGKLSGYRWGVERKRILLEKEKLTGVLGQDIASRRQGYGNRKQ